MLIKEPQTNRANWNFGKIESLDHRGAVATSRSNNKKLHRAINTLFPLELSLE